MLPESGVFSIANTSRAKKSTTMACIYPEALDTLTLTGKSIRVNTDNQNDFSSRPPLSKKITRNRMRASNYVYFFFVITIVFSNPFSITADAKESQRVLILRFDNSFAPGPSKTQTQLVKTLQEKSSLKLLPEFCT